MIKKEKYTSVYVPPPWRNGLACWTSNSKVVGSSPTGGGFLFFIYFSFIFLIDYHLVLLTTGGFYWCILGIFWQRYNWYFEGNLRRIFEVMFICTLLYLIYS